MGAVQFGLMGGGCLLYVSVYLPERVRGTREGKDGVFVGGRRVSKSPGDVGWGE